MTILEDWSMNLSIIEARRILLFQLQQKSSHFQNRIGQNTHFKYLQKAGNGKGNLKVYFPTIKSVQLCQFLSCLFP